MNIIGRYESAVLVSDNHGQQANTATVKKLYGFVEDFKPDKIFHLGDNRDLSSIRKAAAPGEACQSMLEDIAGKEFIEKLRPNVFINGNHDVRMYELAESGNGIGSDFAKLQIAEWEQLYKTLKIDVLPYHPFKGIYQWGSALLTHGMDSGNLPAHFRAFLKNTSFRNWDMLVTGHGHKRQQLFNCANTHATAHMLSCLIKKDQAYMRHYLGMNFWTTGWGVGLRNKKTNKTWILHTEEDGENNFVVPQFGMV